MIVPFSPPDISQNEIDAVTDVLKSGWITSGKVGEEFSEHIRLYTHTDMACLLDSATSGLELALRYFGVTKGDEVITTPYTYASSINVIMHCGATPILVDINPDDFHINTENIAKAINNRTKAVITVDFAGLPVDYNGVNRVIKDATPLFKAETKAQKELGRILFISDAAHSFGALYSGVPVGHQADITVFSFHAVKNLTTAEGGAIVCKSKEGLNAQDLKQWLKIWMLNGQSKSSQEKESGAGWFYEILAPGYRANLPDVLAAIGLSQLKRYHSMLAVRYNILALYRKQLSGCSHIILPITKDDIRESNAHFLAIRLKNHSQRDRVIESMSKKGISLNVHFIPIFLHPYYSEYYRMDDTPIAYENYLGEISLPIYSTMTEDMANRVICELLAILSSS